MNRTLKLTLYLLALLISAYIYYFDNWFHNLAIKYRLSQSIVGFILFFTIVNIGALLIKWSYSKKNKMDIRIKNNVHYGIENIAKFTIGVGIFITILRSLGIDPVQLITSITIVATAIAIITKEYISDFLVGIHLSFSNIFEIGDFVRLGDQKGEVVGINMLKTIIKDKDDDIIMIPNTKVHYNEIVNYTQKDIRLMNVDFELSTAYIDKIDELKAKLISKITPLKKHIEPNSFNLEVVDIHSDRLEFVFQYKLKKVNIPIYKLIRKKVMQEVFDFMKK